MADAMRAQSIDADLKTHQFVVEKTIQQSTADIEKIASAIIQCFRDGKKLLICGNGGSAADAQHVAGEFVNRFSYDRPALPAIALSTDTSILTCVGNDSSFDFIFSRQVEALGRSGDILVGISTSGGSLNVLEALNTARQLGMTTIAFTGEKGREAMLSKCDFCLAVPSVDTPRIQESHIFVWHIICGIVERTIFPHQ